MNYYVFEKSDDTEEILEGLMVAAVWNAWYKAGNPPGDELKLVFVGNEPLGYWLDKLAQKGKKND